MLSECIKSRLKRSNLETNNRITATGLMSSIREIDAQSQAASINYEELTNLFLRDRKSECNDPEVARTFEILDRDRYERVALDHFLPHPTAPAAMKD